MVLRKSTAIVSAMLLTVAATFLSGCGSGPGSGGLERKSGVSLELKWPANYSFDSNTSQLNFASSPKMMAAPAYVTSCRVTISGADMTPVTLDVPLSTGQVGGSVTPGERRFDVVVDTNIGLSFTGSTIAMLVPGNNSGITIQLAVNAPPIVKMSVSNASPKIGEAVTVSIAVADPDASDTHTFTWDGGGGSLSGSGSTVTWVGNKPGSYTVSVTVDDGMGGVVTQSVGINIINHPPVIISITTDKTTVVPGDIVKFSCSATDADGDPLTYTWWNDKGWSANGQNVTYTVGSAPPPNTSVTFTCMVSDGYPGGTDRRSVTFGTGVTAPTAPTGVTAVGAKAQVTVSWSPSAGATSYNLYWSVTSPVTTASAKIAGVTSPYIHAGRTNGTPYYYAVTAVNSAGESALSVEVNATAALMVTKTADTADGVCDSDCSLREAISAANAGAGGETIIIPAGTYTITIPGTNEDLNAFGDLDITKSVAIVGAGSGATIINGGALDRVFDIDPFWAGGVVVSISGVTITGGNSAGTWGGGIYNNGTLTITNSTITGNTADLGGGIKNGASSTLTVTSSTISGNSAAVSGGGIYSDNGSLTVTSSTISGNSAADGGGIYNNTGTLTVTSSTITSNTAPGGGGIYNNTGTVTVTNSTITSNTAPGGGNGGGIHNWGGTATVTVTNSTISGNTGYYGGGIFNWGGGTVTVTNSTITSNTATYTWGGGGGICNNAASTATVTNSTISGNTGYYGGGILNFGALTVTNSTISGNTATTSGGGINRSGGAVTLSNTIVANQTGGANCAGAITSTGYNLSSDASCGFAGGGGVGSLINTNPLLGALANNGGPTQTMALSVGSPAIDFGSCVNATDQRGYIRVAPCDIGAYEFP